MPENEEPGIDFAFYSESDVIKLCVWLFGQVSAVELKRFAALAQLDSVIASDRRLSGMLAGFARLAAQYNAARTVERTGDAR